ncbi:hypothetical protein KIH74_27700 [Kineosporia sp. J2-2]|uniref:Universal stress protein family protein n=1 Tax=Kineosporia corallincola TaxID=2835133 RepID=A0ABS5TNT8_9ACTN|nr:hypothetical protein [Kineosporia corallincola]MBT0772761.1 hypothetical protein [Kineosporia corallincola]
MTSAPFDPMESLAADVVVVGVSDSVCGRGAIVFAADEAYRRGAQLRLVHACAPAEQVSVQADLDRLATMIRAEYPWLPVVTSAPAGRTEQILLDESARASLMVLDPEASRAVAGAAACPVVRVRQVQTPCP